MKISADITSVVSSERTVNVEHGNSSRHPVSFGLALYKKDHFADDNETFRVINSYWAQLPEQAQADIYSVYEDIRELFDSATSNLELKNELTNLVTRLMEHHKTTDVIEWIKYRSGLKVPASIEHEYKYDVDKNTTKDKTYTYDDYIGLMALSIIFRPMIPIWAMFNKPAKDGMGKTLKEFHSFMLLKDSEVYSSEPMERLERYVRANIDKDAYTANHTLEFIPSDVFPKYLTSLVCVSRLCLGELSKGEVDRNLAALVYVYIIDRPGPQGNDYSARVQVKKIAKEGSGEVSDNANSTLELYKARATITPGIVAALEYATNDIEFLAKKLLPKTPLDVIERDIRTATVSSSMMLETGVQYPQRTLAQWFCAAVFPPQGMMYLEDEHLIPMCALTEVVLKHMGFPYLALLATATPVLADKGMRMTPLASKSQITSNLNQRIADNYPYRRISPRARSNGVEHCFVTEDVKKQAGELAKYTWRATADEQLVREVLGTKVRRIPILPQLRTDLFEALIASEDLRSE